MTPLSGPVYMSAAVIYSRPEQQLLYRKSTFNKTNALFQKNYALAAHVGLLQSANTFRNDWRRMRRKIQTNSAVICPAHLAVDW